MPEEVYVLLCPLVAAISQPMSFAHATLLLSRHSISVSIHTGNTRGAAQKALYSVM